MADFNRYAPTLKKLEGGWSDDPYDLGGATMMGVTLATYKRFFGEDKTAADLRKISESQWRTVMKSYWDRCKGDMIDNQSIAEILVDWFINSGFAGIKAWQQAENLVADGIIGPQSLAVLNSTPRERVFNVLQSTREDYYRDIVSRHPSQSRFLKGWINRTRMFRFYNS